MKTSSKTELISPCGMNCALCSSYLSMKNDLKSKGIKMPYCPGCRPRKKNCAFLKKHCSKLSKNEVSFCYECSDFPCRRLTVIDTRYRNRYRMSMIDNLRFIQREGIERFLKNQEELWKCKKCGETVCCHNGICYKCELEKLKDKKQKFRWDEEENP